MNKTKGCLIANFATVPLYRQGIRQFNRSGRAGFAEDEGGGR
uniref:Uncharacterized protein n=1 Tax=Klebsiella pneumoniae TaxID=573 RepID=A0A482M216_KLEPN|nr:hypothetical protein [Klebsiella pneumoniae]QBQ67233.1 hypothetical protein [Klebsiella pneumoniae]